MLLASLLLGLTFRLPGAAEVSRWAILGAALLVALLLGASLLLILLAWRRPPGRR